MHQSARQIYEFGSFQLDRQERLLTREGASVPLTPKAFDLLLALVERHGRLVEKEELFKAVWPDTIVEESNLSSNIALIRKALGERENGLKFIETVPKRGYRFVAVVQEVKDKSAEHSEAAENSGRAKAQPGWLNSKASGDKKSFRVALVMSVILLAGMGFGLYKFVRQAPNKDADIEPRIVPFTSFPHNELDPSFSPDGNQIAFAWDGEQGDNYDIYVKQLGTDALLRLTTNSAAERNPVWSPDSRYIAFTRVSKESCVELYLMPSLGGPERKITECSVIAKNALSLPFSLSPTSWSPDGAWLAVAEKNLMEETTSIFLVAHETGEKRRLTAAPPGSIGDGFPAFSPDGKMIAFARNSGGISELYLVSVVGGEAQRLTFSNGSTNPVWISDGREILFSSNTGGKGGLWKIPAAGGEAERIRPGFVSRFARSRQGQLAWSQVVGDTNIWRLELTGIAKAQPPLTQLIASTRTDTSPQFSFDGQKIVFSSYRSGTAEIWVCSSDGRNAKQITAFRSPQTVGSPRWSPDGRQIVFDTRAAGNADIYIISAEGGKPRRLTTEESEDMVPSFSHDGSWIYFCSNRSGSQQIWKLPAAGGQAVQVTRQGGFDNMESPDGHYLYYAKGRGVSGIWRVPIAGGEETLVLDHHRAGAWRYWAVVPQGIYFLTAETAEHPLLEFFNFATNKIVPIITLEKKIASQSSSLSVSPDGHTLIWSQLDQEGSDIMLLDNFR